MRYVRIVIIVLCLVACLARILRYSGTDQCCFEGSVYIPETDYVIHLRDQTVKNRKTLYVKTIGDHLIQNSGDSCIAIIELYKPQNNIIISFKGDSIMVYDVANRTKFQYSGTTCLKCDSPDRLFEKRDNRSFALEGCFNIGLSGYNNSLYLWPPYNSDLDEGYIPMDSTVIQTFSEKNPMLYGIREHLLKIMKNIYLGLRQGTL